MIKIVSDSSALYSKEDGQVKGISILPLIVTINGSTYNEYEDNQFIAGKCLLYAS